MSSQRHSSPEVNTGSMADIAFLLLIFFLVTTTISADRGINRKLPKNCPPGENCLVDINERNIFSIVLNAKDEILIENEVVFINQLKDLTKSFLDNNGDDSCSYCNGEKLVNASDNPKEAIVSLQNDKLTTYAFYVAVQDEITKAYSELRTAYSIAVFNKQLNKLTPQQEAETKAAYPFILSEAETK